MFIGMATGPAVAGVYMENHSTIAEIQGSYPTLRSYDMVFLTSALLSGISTGFAFVLNRAHKAQKSTREEICQRCITGTKTTVQKNASL
jgi:hypothetical protein